MSQEAPINEPPARRRGRPRGSTRDATRKKILTAAVKEFERVGFEAASLRSVARRANVDPALVHHYFADKSELFLQSMNIPANPGAVIALAAEGPLEDLGEALVRAMVSTWRRPAFRSAATAMVRGMISSQGATKILRPFLQRELFARLQSLLPVDQAEQRVALVATQLVGLVVARYIVELEPLSSLDDEQIIALIGPTIQHYLTGNLPPLTR